MTCADGLEYFSRVIDAEKEAQQNIANSFTECRSLIRQLNVDLIEMHQRGANAPEIMSKLRAINDCAMRLAYIRERIQRALVEDARQAKVFAMAFKDLCADSSQ